MIVLYLIISVIVIILLTVRLKVHPFIALLFVALVYGFVSGMSSADIITSVNEGFGNTLGGIGLIIILGIIIGAFLENSGGAYAIAEKVLKIIGKNRVPTAMGLIGWFVSIPVFADSGFLLLIEEGKNHLSRIGNRPGFGIDRLAYHGAAYTRTHCCCGYFRR